MFFVIRSKQIDKIVSSITENEKPRIRILYRRQDRTYILVDNDAEKTLSSKMYEEKVLHILWRRTPQDSAAALVARKN
jgi:hypothetical protein